MDLDKNPLNKSEAHYSVQGLHYEAEASAPRFALSEESTCGYGEMRPFPSWSGRLTQCSHLIRCGECILLDQHGFFLASISTDYISYCYSNTGTRWLGLGNYLTRTRRKSMHRVFDLGA